MSNWGSVALRNNMANPDRPADPDGVAVTPLTPDAAQWLAAHKAPQPAAQEMLLNVPPSANRYWRYTRGRVVVSEEAQRYKAEVREIAQITGIVPMVGAVAVTVNLYRRQKMGDLDNYAKILLDAMNGAAYADDAQVVEIHMYRYDDKNNPRVEVEVREVTA